MAAVQRQSANSFRTGSEQNPLGGSPSASSCQRSGPTILENRTVTNETPLPPNSLSERISSAWDRVKTCFSSSLVVKAFTNFAHYVSKEARQARAVKAIFDAALKSQGLSKLAVKEHFSTIQINPKSTRVAIEDQAKASVQQRRRTASSTLIEAAQSQIEVLRTKINFNDDLKNLFISYLALRIDLNQSDSEIQLQVKNEINFLEKAINDINRHQNSYGPNGTTRVEIFNRYCNAYGRNSAIHTILNNYYKAAEARARSQSNRTSSPRGRRTGFAERQQAC